MARKPPEGDPGYRWMLTPSLFCDHFSADGYQSSRTIRIAFGEWISKDVYPVYRTAVTMPLSDAKELMRVLGVLIKDIEAQPKTEPEEDTSLEETK